MKPLALLILLLAACAAATCAKVVWNSFHDSEDDPSEVFSHSLSEARSSGVLVSELSALLSTSLSEELRLPVSEAWIEKCAVHRYSKIWFHKRVPAGGFMIVVKLARAVDARFELWPPERKASFTWAGGRYFVRHFDIMPGFPMALVGGVAKDSEPVVTLNKPNQ